MISHAPQMLGDIQALQFKVFRDAGHYDCVRCAQALGPGAHPERLLQVFTWPDFHKKGMRAVKIQVWVVCAIPIPQRHRLPIPFQLQPCKNNSTLH